MSDIDGQNWRDDQLGDVETRCADESSFFVLGVDEAGRGPLAGPVTIGAVLLDTRDLGWCEGLDDSKKLSSRARSNLEPHVLEHALAYAVVHVEPPEIDELNILWATMEGMRRAVEQVLAFGVAPDVVLVDGNRRVPTISPRQVTLVKGDGRSYAIAAASILAKVARDRRMVDAASRYPGFGFERHKGYPTKAHVAALAELGPCAIHRRSFAPVRAAEAAARERQGVLKLGDPVSPRSASQALADPAAGDVLEGPDDSGAAEREEI